MPRIDPISGCTVMTLPEFWNSEAAREGRGRTGADIQADFYAEMAASMEKERQSYFSDHKKTLKAFKDAVKELREYGDDPQYPMPLKIVEVLDVQISEGGRKSSFALKARALRGHDLHDRQEDIIELTSASYSGSFYEPPETETNVWWHGLPLED